MFSEINLLNSAASGNEERSLEEVLLGHEGNQRKWHCVTEMIVQHNDRCDLRSSWHCQILYGSYFANGWCLTPQRAQSLILFHRKFSLWWVHIKTENTCKEFLKLPLLLGSAVSCTKYTFLPELARISLANNYCLCQYCNITMYGRAALHSSSDADV